MKHARQNQRSPLATAAAFGIIALAWIALDRWTKVVADAHEVGEVFVPNVAGLFEFRLVHNTGAAWGMLGDSTMLLGAFSLIVCLAILWYVFGFRHARGSFAETIPLAFVFAGGVGNAVDRLSLGYVVDFIKTTFIEFPVFNVADIGVTCGIVVFMVVLFLQTREQ